MGNRVFIEMSSKGSREEKQPIVFYGHWAGGTAEEVVKEVLDSSQRIGDFGYLCAQMFYHFAVSYNGYEGRDGFGIYSGDVGQDEPNDNPTIYVDCDNGTYTIGDN